MSLKFQSHHCKSAIEISKKTENWNVFAADILDGKYLKICPSPWGDGSCAAKDIPAGTLYANYGGHRLFGSQIEKLKKDQEEMWEARNLSGQYTVDENMDWKERLWMYRFASRLTLDKQNWRIFLYESKIWFLQAPCTPTRMQPKHWHTTRVWTNWKICSNTGSQTQPQIF